MTYSHTSVSTCPEFLKINSTRKQALPFASDYKTKLFNLSYEYA